SRPNSTRSSPTPRPTETSEPRRRAGAQQGPNPARGRADRLRPVRPRRRRLPRLPSDRRGRRRHRLAARALDRRQLRDEQRHPHRRATAEKITGLGIDTTAEEVTTSAQVLAERLAERFGPGARVHLLGTTGLRVALETAGLQITDTVGEAPVAIAQGLDPDIDYEKIVLACRIIRSGAEWWASNPDYSLLTEIGRVPGNGAFV